MLLYESHYASFKTSMCFFRVSNVICWTSICIRREMYHPWTWLEVHNGIVLWSNTTNNWILKRSYTKLSVSSCRRLLKPPITLAPLPDKSPNCSLNGREVQWKQREPQMSCRKWLLICHTKPIRVRFDIWLSVKNNHTINVMKETHIQSAISFHATSPRLNLQTLSPRLSIIFSIVALRSREVYGPYI